MGLTVTKVGLGSRVTMDSQQVKLVDCYFPLARLLSFTDIRTRQNVLITRLCFNCCTVLLRQAKTLALTQETTTRKIIIN